MEKLILTTFAIRARIECTNAERQPCQEWKQYGNTWYSTREKKWCKGGFEGAGKSFKHGYKPWNI